MKKYYRIRDGGVERVLSEDDFPLVIGGSPAAAIRVVELAAEQEAAYIGLSEGNLYVQSAEMGIPVWHNRQKLQDFGWLLNGDKLRIGSYEIVIRLDQETITLQVSEPDDSSQTLPPLPSTSSPSSLEVEPVQFRSEPLDEQTKATSRSRLLLKIGLGLLFAFLVSSAWFVFTARQVLVQIDPKPDRVSIKGGVATPKLGAHFLLRPGSYTLRAVKKGYHPLEHPFMVADDKNQTLNLSMVKLPGKLTLRVYQAEQPSISIEGARVYIDGEEIGATPLREVDVKPGRRRLEIKAENYQNMQTHVVIEGEGVSQSFDLALTPDWAEVTVSSLPAGANVWVAGKRMGKTPLRLKLAAGTYELELRARLYKTWRAPLVIQANQPQALNNIRLIPADGTLALRTTPSGASVTVDKSYFGLTPLDIPLRPNKKHVVYVSKAGYERVALHLKVSAAEVKPLSIDLVPKKGVVHLVVEPPDAEIFIDGKPLEAAEKNLSFIALEHEVEIKKEGYESFRTKITPRPGFPLELRVSLVKQRPKHMTAPQIIRAANGYALKLIHPGSFIMGSSRREQGRRSNETLRKVTLTRWFYLGVREVTNKEFRQFLAEHNSGEFKGHSLNRDKLPVVQVSWEQAALFCNWLSAKDSLPPAYVKKGDKLVAVEPMGTGYRLPTEAEWEYCARLKNGKTSRKYPWGDRFPPGPKSVNIADESAKGVIATYLSDYNDGYPVTAPSGTFDPNELGIYDLGGNVAEWSHDYYSIYTYAADKIYRDPVGPAQGKHRVVRGSSWKQSSISALRVSYRGYGNEKRQDLGFRICRYLEHVDEGK
ncbi:MAG: PEGA domain-containing protein [Deltaproteobacteria bacterium]|nr:MAG: PEGA domain-containing protein [Deltaproteobacteria bacterium]